MYRNKRKRLMYVRRFSKISCTYCYVKSFLLENMKAIANFTLIRKKTFVSENICAKT